MNLPEISEKLKFRAIAAICAVVYLVHFGFMMKYALNIPYMDEWDAVSPGGLLANPNLTEIFAQHNEHRIVTTNLLTLFLYQLNGWNLISQQAINFVIYGLLVCTACYVVKKSVPSLSAWILLCFAVFLLSAISWENHSWGFQTQFHLALLFLFLAAYFLFDQTQSWRKLSGGVFFAWLAIYSLSGGVVETLTVMVCFACFKLIRVFKEDNRQREILQMAATLGLICAAIGAYFIGYEKPAAHPPLTFPYQKEFWIYFFNLLSGGFGSHSLKILPGIIILLVLLFPLLGQIYKSPRRLTSGYWTLAAATLAILAALCAITMGRAGFHSLEQAKSPRYSEVVGMLIPLGVGLWAIFLAERKRMRDALLVAFWLVCAVGFARSWNFSKAYNEAAEGRRRGLECVQNYYHNGGAADCPTIYPVPIADRLESAKTLNLSFVEAAEK